MANRPGGRRHSAPTGSGTAGRRGSGLGTGPVGTHGGYSGRTGSGGGGYGGGGYNGGSERGSGYRRRGGCSSRIMMLVILVVAVMALSKMGLGGLGSLLGGGFDTGTGQGGGTGMGSGMSFGQSMTGYTDASTSAVDETVSSSAREKFTKLRGNGKDVATVLIYMCGADLESQYGMGTADLQEMIKAEHSDQVNIIVETGGAKRWKNGAVSSKTLQRWQIVDNGLKPLDKNVGSAQMTKASTLLDFIKWGTKNYPADRTILILWDHGAGSVQGYGYDENYPRGTMRIDQIAAALKQSGQKFDIIGFDACLMANAEMAFAAAPYADYLIASEETEPGTGWHYTDWLTQLARNTSVPTTSLGKTLIDSFIAASQKSSPSSSLTLSLTDLAEFSAVIPKPLSAFSQEISSSIESGNYNAISKARAATREFSASNKLDQIDLVNFCENVGTADAKALAKAIKSSVKYNRTSRMTNAYGISIYFPYRATSKVAAISEIYDGIGMNQDYRKAIRSFANLESAGQVAQQGSSNPLFDLLGGGSPSNGTTYDSQSLMDLLTSGSSGSYTSNPMGSFFGGNAGSSGLSTLSSLLGGSSGVDQDSLSALSSLFLRSHVDTSNLELTQKNGEQVISLSEDEWSQIRNVSLNVWIDDGQGYLDLGLDDIYEFNDDGDLRMSYDGTWIALNGQPAAYFVTSEEFVSDDDYIVRGYCPAMLDGKLVKIILEFTDENEAGTVLGAQLFYPEVGTEAKGLIEIEDGMKVELVCDCYDYNGTYDDTYYLGDPITVDGGLTVSTIRLDNDNIIYGYLLNDQYNASLYTPMLRYR